MLVYGASAAMDDVGAGVDCVSAGVWCQCWRMVSVLVNGIGTRHMAGSSWLRI